MKVCHGYIMLVRSLMEIVERRLLLLSRIFESAFGLVKKLWSNVGEWADVGAGIMLVQPFPLFAPPFQYG